MNEIARPKLACVIIASRVNTTAFGCKKGRIPPRLLSIVSSQMLREKRTKGGGHYLEPKWSKLQRRCPEKKLKTYPLERV